MSQAYTIQESTLSNLGNQIRILYGTEETMAPAAMASQLGNANTEINEQTDWIEKILEALGVAIEPEANTLNDCSWNNINKIAADGRAANYWSIGDTKKIVLNGTVGTLELSNYETYVYIIGFDHNGATGTIDFGTFKTAESDGNDVCLIDEKYNSYQNRTLSFNINHWGNHNFGGWKRCDLRYDILGSTDIAPDGYGAYGSSSQVGYDATSTCATNPVPNTLMAALPSELRAVMKPMTIYTDNVGGGNGNIESNVTASIDYLPLLAEFEIFGSRAQSNTYETNKQTQYAYYANGNSKIKYRHNDISSTAIYWIRSPFHITDGGDYAFANISTNGTASHSYVHYPYGIAPIFRIGLMQENN